MSNLIPVGSKVKYQINSRTESGYVTKVMLPGYQCNLTSEFNDEIRYCIDSEWDPRLSSIVTEECISDPDFIRMLNDEEYCNKIKQQFENTINSNKDVVLVPELLGTLNSLKSELGSSLHKLICKIKTFRGVDNIGYISQSYGKLILFPSYKEMNCDTFHFLVQKYKGARDVTLSQGHMKLKRVDLTDTLDLEFGY